MLGFVLIFQADSDKVICNGATKESGRKVAQGNNLRIKSFEYIYIYNKLKLVLE